MTGTEELVKAIVQDLLEWRPGDFYIMDERDQAVPLRVSFGKRWYGDPNRLFTITIGSWIFWNKAIMVSNTDIGVYLMRGSTLLEDRLLGTLDLNDPASIDTLRKWMIDEWPGTMMITARSAGT